MHDVLSNQAHSIHVEGGGRWNGKRLWNETMISLVSSDTGDMIKSWN